MKRWCILFAVSAFSTPLRAHADNRVTAVTIVASIDGKSATNGPIYAKHGQHVTLFAVVRAGGQLYSDAPGLAAQPLAKVPAVELSWFRIEPTTANMSNTASGSFRFEAIDYRATAIEHADGGTLVADVTPTLTPDHGHGVGTMRYQVVVKQSDTTIASPGSDARRGRGSGGLRDTVMRVSIRRDDTYLGFLTELYGQPYVWASAGMTDRSHQSERLEGSDCADFVVYGARRLGKQVPYTWTGGLPQWTALLGTGTRGKDGIYRDGAGKPLPFTRTGDLVLFPRHVGVLETDKGEKGVLDDADIIMHSLLDSPKEVPLADSGYADTTLELRRWR